MEGDGCTLWLDGWPTWLGGSGNEWRHCCDRHDGYYAGAARDWGEWLSAHWEAASCIAEISWEMAGVMLLGLIVGTFAFGKKKLPDWHANRK